MKLKMKIGLSGPALSLSPGDPHETDDIEGQRLIDARFADLAAEETLEQRIERLKAELAAAQAELPKPAKPAKQSAQGA